MHAIRDIIADRRVMWILGVAFALRILVALTLDPPLVSDDTEYVAIARSLTDGNGFQLEGAPTAYRPPGYPAFLAFFFLILGPSFVPVRLAQALVDTATCAMVYDLGARLLSPEKGRTAAWLYAVFPLQILYVSNLMTETVVAFLLLLSLRPLLLQQRGAASLVAMGTLLGLTAYLRPTVLMLPVLAAVPALGERVSVSTLVRRVAIVAGTMVLIISPWLIRNGVTFGRLTMTSNTGINFWMGNHAGASGSYDFSPESPIHPVKGEFKRSDLGIELGLAMWVNEPVEGLKLLPKKLAHLFEIDYWQLLVQYYRPEWKHYDHAVDVYRELPVLSVVGTHLPFVAVTLLALYAMCVSTRRENGDWVAISTLVVLWILVHLVFFGVARYRFPLHPLLILAAVHGWSLLPSLRSRLSRPRLAVLILCTCLLVGGWGAELLYLTGIL